MSATIDARGLACPQPVVKVKQAVDSGKTEFDVLVDNESSKENVLRFADANKLVIDAIGIDSGAYRIRLRREGAAAGAVPAAVAGAAPAASSGEATGKTILLAADRIGAGSDELGAKLMLAFLFTLTESEQKPEEVILMNAGVRLATEEPQAVEHLKKLEAAGAEILVCGTCLDFFRLKEKLAVGRVSNMYEIVERLMASPGVVRP